MYFRPIVKHVIVYYVIHASFRSWNQPVLSNESKISCSMKKGAFDGAMVKPLV